jgi:putative transport protein
MVSGVMRFLDGQPFILLFLVVAAGYALGRVRLKGLTLGATAATLLVALALSVFASARYGLKLTVSEIVGSVFFNMFMFSVGMKVGPQFLTGLKRDAKPYIVMGVLTPVIAVGLTLLLRWALHLDAGMTVGILGGANTATPGLGAAQDALTSGAARLHSGAAQRSELGSLSTAFAFSYCVSTLGFVVMLKVLPRVFRRDVVKDAALFEKKAAAESTAPLPGSAEEFLLKSSPGDVRVYRVEADAVAGHTVGALAQRFPRMSIERIRRDGRILAAADDVWLLRGDLVAIAGNTQRLLEAVVGRLGPEVFDPELRDVGYDSADVVIQNRAVAGKTLIALARDAGHGLVLSAMFRGGESLMPSLDTVVQRGDVLRVFGSKRRIEAVSRSFGAVVRPSMTTDIVTLAIGLCAGALFGAPSKALS